MCLCNNNTERKGELRRKQIQSGPGFKQGTSHTTAQRLSNIPGKAWQVLLDIMRRLGLFKAVSHTFV